MGLLVGEVFENNGEKYVVVEEYLTAPNNATSASVRFSENSLGELASKLSKEHPGKLFVGWLHSHPGYGCWLSSTDVATQRKYFNEDWHVALVVDPTKQEQGSMSKRAFKLNGQGYSEVPFAVVRKK